MVPGLTSVAFGGAGSLGVLAVRLVADSENLIRGMRNAEMAVSGGSLAMLRSIEGLAIGAAAALASIGVVAVKEFAKFDKAMVESMSIMGNVSADMRKELESTARTLAKEGVQSAADLAKSYLFLASTGLDAEQSMKALPVVAQFATAGLFDLTKATNFLSDAQVALGLRSEDATKNMEEMAHVADVLTKANAIANGTVEDFASALTNRAAAALRVVNKDIEEGVAVLAAFANQGIKGQRGGEALYISLRDLQRTAINNTKAFADLGIRVFDASGNMNNMADIIGDMEKAMAGATVEERRMTFELLGFQDRSLASILALIGMSGKIREYETALRSAGGQTKDVADKVLTSFSAQMTMAVHRVQDLLITIGEKLAPTILEVVGVIERWVDSLVKAEEENQSISKTVEGFVTVLKVVALGIGVVWAALRSIAEILAGAVIVQIELTNIAIDGAIKLFGYWFDVIKAIVQALDALGKQAGNVGKLLFALVTNNFAEVKRLAAELGPGAIENIKNVGSSVLTAVEGSTRVITETASKAFETVKEHGKGTIEELGTTWGRVVDLHQNMFAGLEANSNNVKKTVEANGEAVKRVGDEVKKTTDSISQASSQVRMMINSAEALKAIQKIQPTKTGLEEMGLTKEELSKLGVSGGTLDMLSQAKKEMGVEAFDPFQNQAAQLEKEQELANERLQVLKEIGENEVALNQEVLDRKRAAVEAYNEKLKQLQMAQAMVLVQAWQTTFDELGKAVKGYAGEQSAAYKAMFAASKAFAIAESIIKIQQGIANALSLPWPANLVAIASVVAAAANIVSTIQSVSLEFGGGKAGGGPVAPGKTFLVGEKGPELFTPSQRGSIVPNDMLQGNGEPVKVIVNNFTDATAEVRENRVGSERVIEVLVKRVKNELSSEIRDGRGDVPRAMESTFNLRRGQK